MGRGKKPSAPPGGLKALALCLADEPTFRAISTSFLEVPYAVNKIDSCAYPTTNDGGMSGHTNIPGCQRIKIKAYRFSSGISLRRVIHVFATAQSFYPRLNENEKRADICTPAFQSHLQPCNPTTLNL
jgi:hypothetical protein